ncbi:hypothetical protein L915_04025 [Phytophthora nicotianae]|nr:hypothetical protein PPTG_22330 [Phytophthora nicotianae INRA-310]ETK92649.1 hypothetical protein L915_04025 [Phytophthora nicotianae]ETN13309.1 hypothetical protein PPTG_22330 [Phytophthora nicotianae INRA-310]ETO81465.1 hypothetical protein F444_04215 [Phytophthora nicotianae P1976]
MRVNEARQNHHITGVHVPLEAHRLRLSAQPLLHVSGSANGRDLASLVHDKRRVLEHSQLLLGRAGLERLTIRADLNDLASVGNTESERAHGVDGRTASASGDTAKVQMCIKSPTPWACTHL